MVYAAVVVPDVEPGAVQAIHGVDAVPAAAAGAAADEQAAVDDAVVDKAEDSA